MITWEKVQECGLTMDDMSSLSWEELENLCTINPKNKDLPDDMEVSFIPMQNVSENGEVQANEIRTVKEVKKGFTYFENGDVLFAKITPCMENGKG